VPGLEVASLSTDKLTVSRTKSGTAKVDVSVVPKKADGTSYANFAEFYQAALLDGARLEATFRQIPTLADSLKLNIHGYRLVIDELPQAGQPFRGACLGASLWAIRCKLPVSIVAIMGRMWILMRYTARTTPFAVM
jgi:hypothetical protein